LPGDLRRRLDRAILALAEDPRPDGCESVKDAPRGTYRVRVGPYRVIYAVLDAEGVIVVARVRKRDESTYRGL
jgi:mRNA interferase RelE/StbE